jgi:hypothetical protein
VTTMRLGISVDTVFKAIRAGVLPAARLPVPARASPRPNLRGHLPVMGDGALTVLAVCTAGPWPRTRV